MNSKTNTKTSNIITALFLMLLLVSYTHTTNLAKMKKSTVEKTATQSRLLSQEEAKLYETNGMEVLSIDISKTCVQALMDAMPPAFCWKSGGDVGRIPTGCPPGYFRFLALCYKECQPGHHFILGVCYKNCDPGYDNHPLSCYKNIFRWYFKSSYIPHPLTNFSDKVPCPGNMYRSGALCYRNCELIGMYNCGIGACVAEKSACLSQIGDMVLKTLEGIGTAVSTVMTLGASTAAKGAAKAGIKAAVKSVGKAGINMAKKTLKAVFTGQFKKKILQKAKNKVKSLVHTELKDFVKGAVSEAAKQTAIQNICTGVWNKAIENTNTQEVGDVTESFANNLVGSLDVLGVGAIVQSCGDVSADGGLGCAKSVVEGLSTFDPTGIMTIAAAFMHPSCDVPEVGTNEPDILEEQDLNAAEVERIENQRQAEAEAHLKKLATEKGEVNKQISEGKLIESVGKNCVKVFNKPNFEGNSLDSCQRVWFFEPGTFNDLIDSFIVGNEARGIFFEDANYNGGHIAFTPGLVIKDVNTFRNGDLSLKNLISSLYFGDSPLVTFSFSDWKDNFLFDDFSNKEINYQLLKSGLVIGNQMKGIKEGREFTKNQKATALSVSMYFKKATVEVEFEDQSKKTFTDSFTLSIDEMPLTNGRTIRAIRLR